jgi:hypothetical protein
MAREISETRRLPVKEAYDLIVTGGGIAGIAGALAAARQGLKTMLLEKSTILGGLATLGLINWYEPLCDGEGRVMTTGIAEELLKLSLAYGYHNLHEQWTKPGEPKENPQRRYATRFNPSVFALALNELLIKEGIELRYDMIGSYPLMEGNVCTGLICESAGGREFFPAKVILDASGDACVAAKAGIPCRSGVNYLSYWSHGCTVESMEKALETRDMVNLNTTSFRVGSNMTGNGHPEGLHFFEGISSEERSEYVRLGQSMLFDKIKKDPVNGSCLYTLPGMIQFRKTRCIVGHENFAAQDGKHEEDSIGAAGDFRKSGRHYEIPLGVIFNDAYPNLLAAGRIAAADGHDGWEILRVIPTAALTGQAAGTAASLMVKQEKAVAELKLEELQGILVKSDVRLHF